ncbi:MAG: hypothetical protein L0H79_14745 [Intrasporangium sp.]|uniref:hypothetical protein n=1 Tax=Intrasporangium sp. TaxID=1925024 RepID=UPI002649B387|nr:hypothetical protein [Intrasporangium sp.]MDN5797001.1 hypothetical protein [Intrasporangium sp.]
MGFLDRLLGREPQRPATPMPVPSGRPYEVPPPGGGASVDDERAIARYRYLLRTAPPEDIERVHTEAFAQLNQEQRQMVLQRLTEDLPEAERPRTAEPADLARSATRAEMSRPGYLQRSFGGGGMGMGGMFAGSMLGTIAGVVVGSAVANALFDGYASSPEAAEAGDAGADAGGDGSGGDGSGGDGSGGDSSAGTGGDAGSDPGIGDAGGDSGFGGFGDFGGGDFGGGDFGF